MKFDPARQILFCLFTAVMLIFCASAPAGNIDPSSDGSKYAWAENVGWLNFNPGQGGGVLVTSTKLSGYVWGENIGWINLDPNDSDPDTGIQNDGGGKLSGFAWAENVGWINFDPNVPGDANDYCVTIDTEGNFSGYAWGENIGWINFGLISDGVKVCKVTFDDLANFVDEWLSIGCSPANQWCQGADLTGVNNVDFDDYSLLADYWLDYCPDSWPLK